MDANVFRIRCPNRADVSRPHVAVDIHQPIAASKFTALVRAVGKCSCGAKTDLVFDEVTP